MKLILSLLLLSTLTVMAAVPEYKRNSYDTNDEVTARNIVTNQVGGILLRGSNITAGVLNVNSSFNASDEATFQGQVTFGTATLPSAAWESSGILKSDGSTLGLATIGAGLTWDGTTLSAPGSGSQTPWTSDIDGAHYFLTNAHFATLFFNTNGGSNPYRTYMSNDASGQVVSGRPVNGSVSLVVSNNQVWWASGNDNFLGVGGTNNMDTVAFWPLSFHVKGNSAFSGKVGIGTPNPAANLDVPGTNTLGTIVSTNFQQAFTNATGTAVTVDWNGPDLLRLDLSGATAILFTNAPSAGSLARRKQLILYATTTVPAVTISQTDPRQINWMDNGPYLLGTFTNILTVVFDGTNFLGSSAQVVYDGSGFPVASNAPSIFNLTALGNTYFGQNTNMWLRTTGSSATAMGTLSLEATNAAGGYKSLFWFNPTNQAFSLGGGAIAHSSAGTVALPGNVQIDSSGRLFMANTLTIWGNGVMQTSNQFLMRNITSGRRGARIEQHVATNVASFAALGTDILNIETNGIATVQTNAPLTFTTTGYTNTTGVNVRISAIGAATTVTKFERNGTSLMAWGAVTGQFMEDLKPNQYITTSGTPFSTINVETW